VRFAIAWGESSSRDRGFVVGRKSLDGVEVCEQGSRNTRWNAPRPDVSYPGTTLVGEQSCAILDLTTGDSRSDGARGYARAGMTERAREMVVQRVCALVAELARAVFPAVGRGGKRLRETMALPGKSWQWAESG
jgi:hypothetical protein